MLANFRSFFTRIFETQSSTLDKLAREASAAARGEAPATLVVLVDTAYLPRGGRDRLALQLRHDGGRIERIRTPHRGAPCRMERPLTGDESQRVSSELVARGIWRMAHRREAIRDGLVCAFAFAQDGQVHSVLAHSGDRSSEQLELLGFLRALVPIDEVEH